MLPMHSPVSCGQAKHPCSQSIVQMNPYLPALHSVKDKISSSFAI